jgi:anti-sigma regulatory factor (Ser/Thr protein kinase)
VTLTFTSCVPAVLGHRDWVGGLVDGVCRMVESHRQREGLAWRVRTAFNEAFANVVNHAYSPSQAGWVGTTVRVEAARVVLEVTDDGPGFDFDTRMGTPLPSADALDAGGMGIFIIRSAVSNVSYRRGTPNRLTMTQEISHCAAVDAAAKGSRNEGSSC